MTDGARKPVLWVSATSAGRGEVDRESMDEIQERLEDAFGDDYEIVVADDRVRLATREDLQRMQETLDDLLPSEVETEARQQERQREELGLSADDVMGSGTETPGVHPAPEEGAEDE